MFNLLLYIISLTTIYSDFKKHGFWLYAHLASAGNGWPSALIADAEYICNNHLVGDIDEW